MNISKHSFITRLLCCLLVCLLLCGTVMRPISADATVAGATAGLAYVTVEAVIPWILSALGVGYLASYGSELFYLVWQFYSVSPEDSYMGFTRDDAIRSWLSYLNN